ncbi:flagellar basal body rod protein FlgB [Heyndrickxia vini]|uniref:Flagellar basal body rod protein FlgB n=1 Tax=Heyndrickxia vini TaxID=1476025 RepID=A0ABX7DWT1_9BACI|nr:flagellar basal body rod protein FlgB [Heyndrickxia vini]QQZ07953.1 flagellar basal body rod protein FlgB [Heyndrickxia vini]
MNLFSTTFNTLERALDYSSLKQKVIADNIANVDTPNYKPKEVSFKQVFDQQLNQPFEAIRTDSRHFEFQNMASDSLISTQQNIEYNENGNGVDVDKEMSDLATNQIYYDALSDRISGKFSTLQTVIRGGK